MNVSGLIQVLNMVDPDMEVRTFCEVGGYDHPLSGVSPVLAINGRAYININEYVDIEPDIETDEDDDDD